MQNLRASKQWFVALLSIVSVMILVPTATAAAPTITGLVPAEVHAGWPSFTLQVEGANFIAESKVYWAGRELATKFESSKLLSATVPADLISAKGTALVAVSNAETKSTDKALTIEVAKPLISSLSPLSVAPGSEGFTLTINGSDFVNKATTVKWENTSTHVSTTLTTTSVTTSVIKASVSKSLIAAAGTAAVTVTTTMGGTSSAVTFLFEPKPVLSSLTPASAIAGNPDVTLTISGSNFIKGAQVVWKTPAKTTKVTPAGFTATKITLPPSVTAPLLVNSGKTDISASITVITAAGVSAAKTFTIDPEKPLITTLSPASVAPGGPPFTLTINGANFVKNATTVKWKNTATGAASALPTTSVSKTVIKASVPKSLIETAGTAAVTVTTTTGGTSAAATFYFESKPVLSSLSPTSAIAGDPDFTLTLSGSNFIKGAQVVWKTPSGTTKITPTGFTTTKISLPPSVTEPLLVNSGKTSISASVSVATAAGTSAALTFKIEPVQPAIISLSPDSAKAGGPQFTLTVNGYNFAAGSQVFFNKVGLITVVKKPTELTATVPSNLIQTAGTASVAVESNKIVSQAVSFQIISGTKPAIVSIYPTSAKSNGPSFYLQITGTGFVPGGTFVGWAIAEGATTQLTPVSYGQDELTVLVPAAQIVTAGQVTVSVKTSAGTSNGVKFTITQSAPTLAVLSPSSTTAGQTSPLALTITGTGFIKGATAYWTPTGASKPTALSTAVVSANKLSAIVPVNLLAAAGSANVAVTTSAGTSNSGKFMINASGSAACGGDHSGDAKLSGVYSFQFAQTDPTNNGEVNYNVGTFTADGNGNITGGIQDSNGPYFTSANTNVSFTGSYSVGGDSRGLLTLNYNSGAIATANVCIALDSFNAMVAGGGRLVTDATSNPLIDSGFFYAQGSSSIGASTVAGSWALGLEGIKLDPNNGDETRGATAGYITLDGVSKVTVGEADTSQDEYSSGSLKNSSQAQVALTGTYTLDSSGRGTLALKYGGAATASNYVFYVAGTNQIFLLSIDTGGKGGSAVMSGRALLRPSSISFGSGTLKGNSVFIDQALTKTTSTQYDHRLIQAGILDWNGSGSYTEDYDQNDAGDVSVLQTASSTYSVDSSGRVTINGASPSIFGYLVDTNEGFAVGGNLGVSSMYFESQATGGFSLASFSGDYSEGSVGYGFVQEEASSGEINASGSGVLTGSIDVAGTIGGCVDCAAASEFGAAPDWTRPMPRDLSLRETYATSSVAGRLVVENAGQTVQALYLVSPDKAYAVDILSGDAWQTLEVFNHQ